MDRFPTTRAARDTPHRNFQNPIGMVLVGRYRQPRLIGRHATPFAECVTTVFWHSPSQVKRPVAERALIKRTSSAPMKSRLDKRGAPAR